MAQPKQKSAISSLLGSRQVNPGQAYQMSFRTNASPSQVGERANQSGFRTQEILDENGNVLQSVVDESMFPAESEYQKKLEDIRTMLAAQESQIDLSPAQTLSKLWSSNPKALPNEYKPQNTADEKLAKDMKILEMIQQSKESDYTNRLKMMQMMNAIPGESASVSESSQAPRVSGMNNPQNSFNKDVMGKLNTARNEFNQKMTGIEGMTTAIKNRDLGQIKSFSSLMARAMGEVGVLTDSDVRRLLPPDLGTDIASFENYLLGQFGRDAKPNQESLSKLSRIVDAARTAMNRKLESSLQSIQGIYSTDPRWNDQVLGQSIKNIAPTAAQKAPAPKAKRSVEDLF